MAELLKSNCVSAGNDPEESEGSASPSGWGEGRS